MTTYPSEILRGQARFERQAQRSGSPLTLTYAGPPTRAPMNGFVARAPLGTATVKGFLDFGGVVSDLVREKVDKWGKGWLPDGYVLLPVATETANLASLANNLPGGETYDVLYALPPDFVQHRCLALCVRREPVYNRMVQVRVQEEMDDVDDLLLGNLPCRLTPLDGGLTEDDFGLTLAASLSLECPFVVEGDGILGAGVADGPGAAGRRIYLTPKRTVVVDDPAAYGQTGPVLTYRVVSVNQDPGGDSHHCRYVVSRA